MENNDIILGKYEHFGFLYNCLLRSAVTEKELQKAMENLVVNCEDIDLLEIYSDLLEYDGSRSNLLENFEKISIVGWRAPISDNQRYALVGIAFQRGNRFTNEIYDDEYKKKAIGALKKHPEVIKLLRKFFPFIDF